MNFSAIIEREVNALRRDRQYEKKASYSIEELWDKLDEYPSLVTRFHRLSGTVSRARDMVLATPRRIKGFIHRGRYGWAEQDTWSMDYSLAKQLDSMFRGFVEVSKHIVDYDEDDTASIALDIADGFAAYVAYQDKEWSTGIDPREDFDLYMDRDKEEYERARAMVQRSCELMGQHWQRFWW